jgi:hypothetical protein
LLGVGLFLLLLFGHVLIQPGEVTLGRENGDARDQFYGWRAYGFGEIKDGRLPLWNPYEHLGMPFVASIQSAIFYPVNWFCVLFKIGRGINFSIIFGLFLSAAFTFLWCRRAGIGRVGSIIAGATYALAGPQFLRIYEGHWSFLAPMSWTPLIFLAVEMLAGGSAVLPSAGLGAFAVGMQLLGGNPQYAFYAGIAASLYFIARLWMKQTPKRRALQALGGFAAMYLTGALISAVQFMPALELLAISSRIGQLTFLWVVQYSLTPESLLMLLIPDIFSSDITAQYWGRWNLWEMSLYIGAAGFGLFMAAFATRRRGLFWPVAIVGALLLLLALGNHGPLFALCYRFVPGFDLFRVPARFLAPLSLLMAMMVGLGADTLIEVNERVLSLDKIRQEEELLKAQRRLRVPTWIMAVLSALLLGAGLPLAIGVPGMRETWLSFMDWMLTISPRERLYLQYMDVTMPFKLAAMRDTGVCMLLSGLLLAAAALATTLARQGSKAMIIAAVLMSAVAVDFWGFGRRYLVTFDPRDKGLTPGAIQWLRDRPEPARVARGGDFSFPQCEGMTHRLFSLEGTQPNVTARFRNAFWVLQGLPKDKQTTSYDLLAAASPMLMMNLQYFVQYVDYPPATDIDGLKPGVYQDERIRIDELPGHWPRAWLVHDYYVFPNSEELLYTLPVFDYRRCALLERDPRVSVTPPAAPEQTPKFTRYEPNLVEISTEPAGDALMILSDLYYPGWEVTVDGEPAELLCANYLMRGVALKAGPHTVRFEFKPKSIRNGLAMTAAGLAAMLAMLFAPALLKRMKPRTPAGNGGAGGREG